MIEAQFEGSEGRIFYPRWDPDGPPARIVQIMHGYAEHGGPYGHGTFSSNSSNITILLRR